ncbi:helix-turn-helix domain-containing protein [Citrobacter portucalensis]|uniref:helix-turn-helix domain-containing protein n=1 Tax=Citrobacter portucalensis TaxID=1639133 RepID=UPI00226B136E|nr:helix-turn-helix transcriptional regulator [Citrobacter portucalensis]MCX9020933.1 helix-turn-helix domain-containing protein [Citrobacter portucalensis]
MAKTDWHPADIIAALHKRGTSLAAVSRKAGLASPTLSNTLKRPWPKGEMLIAQAIGVDAAEIWPSRYYDDNGNQIVRKCRQRHNSPAGKKVT